jgi:MFS transporter, ACS family, tartrate transporter
MPEPSAPASALETSTMRAVSWRLMPFLLAAYIAAYIDRANIGFAALQMNKAVGIDAKTFGLGAGIFFVGYFILEVPSNLALERFGARKWIARIMISWGIISAGFALIGGPTSFLIMRFALGAAEAGFFPGVILYLTYWYPATHRARIVGIFMVAIPAANAIASPISGAILQWLSGALGLAGWQWIFIAEGIPSALLGVYALFWLTDRPADAKWLTAEQRDWLKTTLDTERARKPKVPHTSAWAIMFNKHVLAMALVYSGAVGASTSLGMWTPQLIKPFGLDSFQIGLVNTIPFVLSAIWMVLWGRSSDRSGERVWHNAIPLAWMVVAIVLMLFAHSLWTIIPLLTLVAAGTYASKGPFWALSSEWLGPAAAAAGLAQINALGNLSGFFFNYAIGYIRDATGSYDAALTPVAAVAAIGTVTVIIIGKGQARTVATHG